MGVVLVIVMGMCACALSIIGWCSVCLVGGWPLPMEETVRGVSGLFFVVSAIVGIVLQIAWG